MARPLTLILLVGALFVAAGAASGPSSTGSPVASRTVHAGHLRRAVTGAATAASALQNRNPVTTAAAIAERYWHAVPCGGKITILANAPLTGGLSADADGWVTFASSLGADNLDAPPATYTNCTITLAHWQWATWTDMETDWGMFCLTMTHEMGHLLGHKHSLAPGSVMAAVFTSHANVPAACNATWLPGWRPAPSHVVG